MIPSRSAAAATAIAAALFNVSESMAGLGAIWVSVIGLLDWEELMGGAYSVGLIAGARRVSHALKCVILRQNKRSSGRARGEKCWD